MQESAQAAMSYIRSRAPSLGLERDFYSRRSTSTFTSPRAHPQGRPDGGHHHGDGAVVGAAARSRCGSDVAMTGEITLRGRVLPIGGLKEKLLAAHRAGITTVIMPEGEPRRTCATSPSGS